MCSDRAAATRYLTELAVDCRDRELPEVAAQLDMLLTFVGSVGGPA